MLLAVVDTFVGKERKEGAILVEAITAHAVKVDG